MSIPSQTSSSKVALIAAGEQSWKRVGNSTRRERLAVPRRPTPWLELGEPPAAPEGPLTGSARAVAAVDRKKPERRRARHRLIRFRRWKRVVGRRPLSLLLRLEGQGRTAQQSGHFFLNIDYDFGFT